MNYKFLVSAVVALLATTGSSVQATTIQESKNRFRISQGVAFDIANESVLTYTFSWSDDGGDFLNIPNPTLILYSGQTYTFQRVSPAHPFVITDNTMPVTGSDGSFLRDTLDGAVIDAATLEPIADFTADGGPTTDLISWTPDAVDAGTYYYTCRVLTHTRMTGALEVLDSTVSTNPSSWSAIKSLY